MESIKSVAIKQESSHYEVRLTPLEINSICTILEDTIDQIIVIGSIDKDTNPKPVELQIEDLKTRAAKYAKNDPIYNIINGEFFRDTINKMKYLKLQEDRTFLEEILIKIRNELTEDRNFSGIIQYVENLYSAEYDEQTLITDESNNKLYASNLRATIQKTIETGQHEIDNIDETIAKCKDQIETTLFDNALKLRYVESWENARIEQGFMICDQNEGQLTDTINKYKNEIEKEIRINSEIELYITENQKDIEDGIEDWMKRYDTEIENRNTEIQILKEKREEQQKRFEWMTETYAAHATEIQDFLEYMENKRIQDEIDTIQRAAAIKIQAWWRGLMVRLKLGPFNPNPRKKKRKKEKKAKKTKKKK